MNIYDRVGIYSFHFGNKIRRMLWIYNIEVESFKPEYGRKIFLKSMTGRGQRLQV